MATILKIKMTAICHPWYTSIKNFLVLWDRCVALIIEITMLTGI